MITLSASEARSRLDSLIDEAALSHDPVRITGKRRNAVLLSEEDWDTLQERINALPSKGIREPIKEGLTIPTEEYDENTGC